MDITIIIAVSSLLVTPVIAAVVASKCRRISSPCCTIERDVSPPDTPRPDAAPAPSLL